MDENQNTELENINSNSEMAETSEPAGGENFEEMIKGKYKEDFSKKVQTILEKRFKNNGRLFEIAEKLKNEYGVEDEKTLIERIKSGSNIDKGADDFKVWKTQGEKLKELYTDFDLSSECRNPEFVSILRSGADMKTAYEFTHREEILNEAIRFTATKVKESVLSDVRARGLRPIENGVSERSAAVMQTDVRSLSKQDREEMSRRVLRGEKIKF